MDTMNLLATTLGLATLCGVNLYLTVFMTGISLHWHWLHLSPSLQSLQVLDHPAIIITAAVLYAIQFFADKIPYFDTLWDIVHTAIRPLGAMILALAALGQLDPTWQVIGVLLAGAVAMGTHLTKAGTRVLINHSPEPFSNSAASLAEDGLTLGGIALTFISPWFIVGIGILLFVLMAFLAPKIVGTLRRAWRTSVHFLRGTSATSQASSSSTGTL